MKSWAKGNILTSTEISEIYVNYIIWYVIPVTMIVSLHGLICIKNCISRVLRYLCRENNNLQLHNKQKTGFYIKHDVVEHKSEQRHFSISGFRNKKEKKKDSVGFDGSQGFLWYFFFFFYSIENRLKQNTTSIIC